MCRLSSVNRDYMSFCRLQNRGMSAAAQRIHLGVEPHWRWSKEGQLAFWKVKAVHAKLKSFILSNLYHDIAYERKLFTQNWKASFFPLYTMTVLIFLRYEGEDSKKKVWQVDEETPKYQVHFAAIPKSVSFPVLKSLLWNFKEVREQILNCERLLLHVLGFDFHVDHPHAYIMRWDSYIFFCDCLDIEPNLSTCFSIGWYDSLIQQNVTKSLGFWLWRRRTIDLLNSDWWWGG